MIESNKKIIFNMEGLTMIGIKNNNGFFRISVAVIMLLSTLGLIRLSAQSHDTVDSYSETFYAFYGFFPYEFYFGDNRARRLTVNFYGKNRLVIENNSYVLGIKIVRDKDRGLFPFRDTIYFHVIDPPQKELSVRHRQIIVDSVTSTRHITASQTVPPYRDIKFEDTNMVFPLLQKSDTIFVSRNNRHLRIRDFEFSVYQYVTLPNGEALKQESVKFPPQERMRPIIYKKFLKWVEEEKSKDDGLVPDETILKIIDKYYDWDAK